MTRLSRRRVVWCAMGGLGAVSALAACGTGSQGSGSAPVQDLKGTVIEFWTWNAAAHPESVGTQKVVEDFAAKNSQGVKVNFTAPGTGGQATYEKYAAALTAGTPPDAAIGQHFYMSDLQRQGGLVDVETELKSNPDWKKAKSGLTSDIIAGFTWKGKLFAVPWYTSHFSLYYQPEFLKRAGLTPPAKNWTWDQFTDYQKKAARPPDVWGYEDQWSYSRTGMLVLNNGHRFLSADGTKFSYNSPEAIEAVEYQLNLTKQGLMPPSLASFPDGKWKELMPDGKVVFEFAVANRVTTYRKNGTQFGTGYYPIGKSSKDKKNVTHGEAYGVSVFKNKDAKKQQAALLAALWGARPDMGLVLATEAGVPPAYKSTVEDPAFQAQFKKDAESWPFYDLIPGYIPMPNFPGFGDVRTMGDKMIPDIWNGKGTAKQVLDEYTRLAQQKLDEVLK